MTGPSPETAQWLVRHPKRGKHHVQADAWYTRCATRIRPDWEVMGNVSWADKDACLLCAKATANADPHTCRYDDEVSVYGNGPGSARSGDLCIDCLELKP